MKNPLFSQLEETRLPAASCVALEASVKCLPGQ